MKISVKDQGIGIPERHLDKIFDSVPNEGTTVHVYLPASDEASLSGGKEREGIPRGEGRVLLIDDEEMIRKAGSEALTRLGYAVTLAAVGAEGARMYEEAMKGGRPFDVVLLDLTVPAGKGGRDTVRELLRIHPNAKVIASSGYSNSPAMADCRAYGFREGIVKPYRIAELGEVLHRVMQSVD